MQIIVIGAGIAGLSTALSLALEKHKVTVLESASALAEIGAGVQLTPNATKWFWKWGCGQDILAQSALPGSFNVRRDTDASILGQISFKDFDEKYGAPYVVIHRADIHRILHAHAEKAGVFLKLSSRVVEYDFENGNVVLTNGEKYTADLVVAVDGINSPARAAFAENYGLEDVGLEATGWAAYRTMAKVAQLKENPTTAALVSEHDCNCFVGNERGMMTYMVKNSKNLNMVMMHRDDVDTANWSQEQFKEAVIALYEDFGPAMHDLVQAATGQEGFTITNWPVYQVKNLPRWTSKSGKFVIMGDAAHAMAFFLSMGVSMAVEDAMALTECLRLHCDNQNKLSLIAAMELFEAVRKHRAEAVREASLHAGNILQLPPGSDRVLRDEALRSNGASEATARSSKAHAFYLTRKSYGIIDNDIRDWAYAYDVVKDVHQRWSDLQTQR